MDKPRSARIEGIPPAIAIDQTNPVRTSRSTVGTMTELNDHLKLLYARAATPPLPRLRQAGAPRRAGLASSTTCRAARAAAGRRSRLVWLPGDRPPRTSAPPMKSRSLLARRAIRASTPATARAGSGGAGPLPPARRGPLRGRASIEALKRRMRRGAGGSRSQMLDGRRRRLARSAVLALFSDLHCADCDIPTQEPTPGLFSFNSPIGACETCRGFGRVIGVDFGLVVPGRDRRRSPRRGEAVADRATAKCQGTSKSSAKRHPPRHPVATCRRAPAVAARRRPEMEELGPRGRALVRRAPLLRLAGDKAHKMHIRVLLSRYRAYPCPRLKPPAPARAARNRWFHASARASRSSAEALLWRRSVRRPPGFHAGPTMMLRRRHRRVPRAFVAGLRLMGAASTTPTDLLLGRDPPSACATAGRRPRLPDARPPVAHPVGRRGAAHQPDHRARHLAGEYAVRARRTVHRPAPARHGAAHPRVMERLRDAGNSLVVVEHDPQMMLAADRLLDIGPGPGERGGGEIVASARRRRSPTIRFADRRLPGSGKSASTPRARRAGRLPTRCAHAGTAAARQHNLAASICRYPAAAPHRHHRRVRLGQIDADPGRAASRPR